jgi:hypothetical protein
MSSDPRDPDYNPGALTARAALVGAALCSRGPLSGCIPAGSDPIAAESLVLEALEDVVRLQPDIRVVIYTTDGVHRDRLFLRWVRRLKAVGWIQSIPELPAESSETVTLWHAALPEHPDGDVSVVPISEAGSAADRARVYDLVICLPGVADQPTLIKHVLPRLATTGRVAWLPEADHADLMGAV